MSDTERLNLIEHYEWFIVNADREWQIEGKFGKTKWCKTIRSAIGDALTAQAKWSIG